MYGCKGTENEDLKGEPGGCPFSGRGGKFARKGADRGGGGLIPPPPKVELVL